MSAPMSDDLIARLDSAIRTVVVSLRAHGFDTCDSGDGRKTQEGALDFPHVFAEVSPRELVAEADRLTVWLIGHASDEGVRAAAVEATYSPIDGKALVAIYNVTGGMIAERCPRCRICRDAVLASFRDPTDVVSDVEMRYGRMRLMEIQDPKGSKP